MHRLTGLDPRVTHKDLDERVKTRACFHARVAAALARVHARPRAPARVYARGYARVFACPRAPARARLGHKRTRGTRARTRCARTYARPQLLCT
jgi:hypothetical protein